MKRGLLLLTGIASALLAGSALGAGIGSADTTALRGIPILDGGRVKPLETYANSLLLQFSGRRTLEGKPALDWLCRLLFDPASTRQDKVFLINHPDLVQALGAAPEKRRRYNFADLEKGYAKLQELAAAAETLESKERSGFENEALRVHENLDLYLRLSHSFDFALPHPDFRNSSFLDEALKAHALSSAAASLAQKNPKDWTASEKESFRRMAVLYQWSQQYQQIDAFHVIPPAPAGTEEWLSPWSAIGRDFSDPRVREELIRLAELDTAYRSGDAAAFRRAAADFGRSTRSRSTQFRGVRLTPLELLYNRVQPFLWGRLLYGALLLLIGSISSGAKRWRRIGFRIASAAFALHTFGLFSRITIMGRPPVGTLYETFLFVSWIAAGLGLLLERSQKNRLGLLITGSAGFILLTIAGAFGSDGDTMRMLVAVLNSNFWLSTHVLAITTGYAGCCVAGILGHVYLVQSCIAATRKSALEKTHRMMLLTLGFGLLFSALGTALGGIWADQSWGRFWGWDPKENGALMIVLWCAAIFHARLAGLIRQIGTAAGCVLLMAVVIWAWFGVNLLSVGLHSYGFTSGIALNLLIYGLAEAVFLCTALPLALKTAEKTG